MARLIIPTTAELLHKFDATRPRSRQTELGMSELGGCRRAAGYRVQGWTPEPAGPAGLQAVLGTSVDDAVTRVLHEMKARGELPPDALIQPTVNYAGITGHPDLFVSPTVRDTKTLGFSSQLDRYAEHGPPRRHRWQVFMYGAALLVAGHQVERVELDYLDRGSGRDWQWSAPFTVEPVREALEWLRYVSETEVDLLPRDHLPDSAICQACPFRRYCWTEAAVPDRDELSALYLDHPDANYWATELREARAAARDAEAREKRARGALDAIRPNDSGDADLEIAGLEKRIRFSVGRRESLDRKQIEADYAEVGRVPPVTVGHPVSLKFVNPPRPGARPRKKRKR